MQKTWLSVAVIAAVATPICAHASIASKTEFCRHLKAFEQAPFDKGSDGLPLRRFAEFQWSSAWLTGGTWGCRHSPDAVAKSYCSFLLEHTNQEFSAQLPMHILACHGYVFPTYPSDWRGWVADIRLRGPADDRSLDLDVYLIQGSVDAAMRISAVPYTASSGDLEPPPLKRTPPL